MFEIYLNPTSSLNVKIKSPVEIVFPKGNTPYINIYDTVHSIRKYSDYFSIVKSILESIFDIFIIGKMSF